MNRRSDNSNYYSWCELGNDQSFMMQIGQWSIILKSIVCFYFIFSYWLRIKVWNAIIYRPHCNMAVQTIIHKYVMNLHIFYFRRSYVNRERHRNISSIHLLHIDWDMAEREIYSAKYWVYFFNLFFAVSMNRILGIEWNKSNSNSSHINRSKIMCHWAGKIMFHWITKQILILFLSSIYWFSSTSNLGHWTGINDRWRHHSLRL